MSLRTLILLTEKDCYRLRSDQIYSNNIDDSNNNKNNGKNEYTKYFILNLTGGDTNCSVHPKVGHIGFYYHSL